MPDTGILTGLFSGAVGRRPGSGEPAFRQGYPAHGPSGRPFQGGGWAGATSWRPLATGESLPLMPRRWRARDILAVLLIVLASLAIAGGFGLLELSR